MPAKDRHHDAVVRALRKDGWPIIREQFELIVPSRRLWIDIRAAREARSVAIRGSMRLPPRPHFCRMPSGNASSTRQHSSTWV